MEGKDIDIILNAEWAKIEDRVSVVGVLMNELEEVKHSDDDAPMKHTLNYLLLKQEETDLLNFQTVLDKIRYRLKNKM